MTFGHLVVWLDQTEAHVIHFNRESAESESVRSGKTHARTHGAHPKVADDRTFLEDVTNSIRAADEILVVGPGMEKLALIKHLVKHHHDVSEKVVGVESVDHPTNGQLLAYARKYFRRVDAML